jgi:PurA ssDNA and RNA-binding protein
MFDPMSELTGDTSMRFTDRPARSSGPRRQQGGNGGGHGGDFAKDIHSVSMRTEQRTFYFDLKESSHGKFIKLSEKSRNGRKSTIMLNATDLDEFMKALEEVKSHF